MLRYARSVLSDTLQTDGRSPGCFGMRACGRMPNCEAERKRSLLDLLLIMAVLPAAWLLIKVHQYDPVEKEPPGLLAGLLVLGGLACIPAIALESIGADALLRGGTAYTVGELLVENFIIVALSEELCKWIFLRLRTWRSPHFNYMFDGIVYAVFVSLGFAIFENIGYVYQFGMETAFVRAFTAIPGHAVFGVFMGCFYGLEKRASVEGKESQRLAFAVCSLAVPVVCHGFYDFCASFQSVESTVAFYGFLVLVVVLAVRLVKQMSHAAHPIERVD